MKTLKSFGCSFIYGTDLSDDISKFNDTKFSNLTWPALTAKKLNLNYECYARPGQGNFKIYTDILTNSITKDSSLFVINWTWIDRFDYIDRNESWQTLRPAQENPLQKFYYQNLHSQIHDMISNATYIVAAAQHLQDLQIPFIMTYMDHLLFETINLGWHNPKYVESLQHKLSSILTNFDGVNFLEWSCANNYAVSKQWHPLEEAHSAAADFWLPEVKKLI
jgi:hypothetical protein